MQNRPALSSSGSFNQNLANPTFTVGSPVVNRAPSISSQYQPAGTKVDLADRAVYASGSFQPVLSRPPSVGGQQTVLVRNQPITTIHTGPQVVAVARPMVVSSNVRHDGYEPEIQVKKNPCGNICWGLLGLLGLTGLILGILFGVGVIGSKRTDIQNVANTSTVKSSSDVDLSKNINLPSVNIPNYNVNVPSVNINTQPIRDAAANAANTITNTVSTTTSNIAAIPNSINPTLLDPIIVRHASLRKPSDNPQPI